jgi:hypothetical protein
MRILTVTAAALLLSAPAIAQNPADSSQQNPSTSMSQPQQDLSTPAPQTQGQQNAQKPQTPGARIAQQIRHNLEQAGFKNIKLMPSSFIVRAEDQNNNPVMMVINPDSITALTQSGSQATVGQGQGQDQNPGQGQSQGQGTGSSSSSSGSNNNPAIKQPGQ